MLWNWIRNRARNAVLAGLGDAVAELEQGGSDELGPAVARLQAHLQPALPAPGREQEQPPAPDHGNGVAPRGRKQMK